MTEMPAQNDRRRGISNFAEEDDVPLPTPDQIAAAKAAGEGLGFRSEKPGATSSFEEKPRIGGNGRPAIFTMNFHIRTRPEDRTRFEDFAHRHRLSKGDAMSRLLDLAEIEERRQAQSA